MKKEITVKAKSLEEALAEASAQLGVPASQLEYTVLSEARRGFLGIGASDAEIIASYTPMGEKNALNFINTIVSDMQLDVSVSARQGGNDDLLIEVNGEGAGILVHRHLPFFQQVGHHLVLVVAIPEAVAFGHTVQARTGRTKVVDALDIFGDVDEVLRSQCHVSPQSSILRFSHFLYASR